MESHNLLQASSLNFQSHHVLRLRWRQNSLNLSLVRALLPCLQHILHPVCHVLHAPTLDSTFCATLTCPKFAGAENACAETLLSVHRSHYLHRPLT